MMKNLHKKVEKELNHEMQPTEFIKINTNKRQIVIRGNEIAMEADIDPEVEKFKHDHLIQINVSKLKKSICEID
jgi:hypothetical protein